MLLLTSDTVLMTGDSECITGKRDMCKAVSRVKKDGAQKNCNMCKMTHAHLEALEK